MKKQFLYLLLFTGITAFMVACAQARDESSSDRESAATEAAAAGEITGKDGLVDITDERRKMMKNADLKMRVTDVQKATISLERATAAMGGLVMQSEISNEIGAIKELPYTTDSLKMARTYQTTSLLKVRVPTMYLDSFLDLAAAQAQFINCRNILVEDASLQYLSNDLKQQIGAESKNLDKAGDLSRKTSEALEVARTEENIAASKIDKQIDNLNIRDKVKYATVSIAIVQPEKVDVCTVADVSKQMEAGWGTQFRNALGSGWSFLKVVLIGLVHIWPLWMIALIVLIVFRNRKKLLARIKAV